MQEGNRTVVGLLAGFAIGLVVLGGAALTFVPTSMWSRATSKSPVPAQTATVIAKDDPRSLAHTFLLKANIDKKVDTYLLASRGSLVAYFESRGAADDNAAIIADRYIMPELRAGWPELLQRLESVMVRDFTVPELRALLGQGNEDALRSAQSKASQFSTTWIPAWREWGDTVGQDAYRKHKNEIDRLILGSKGNRL